MKKIISVILTVTMVFSMFVTSSALSYDIDYVLNDTANYLYNTVSNPQIGSIGGEWTVLGLARSGIDIPSQYYANYYQNVEDCVKNCNGILHDKKYTEYSRVIVALTAIGKNPQDVAGYNLLVPLADFEKTTRQGLNGAIWALIALDSGSYNIPVNANARVQATREMYIEHILKNQTADGGWALSSNTADPDVTGMALQALSKYGHINKVKLSTDAALNAVSRMQDDKGGFSSFGTPNSESCVQMLVALCELGISVNDERFVKNGCTILNNLLNYYTPQNGFAHQKEGSSSNLMATEQGFYGLVAVKRAADGKNSLYTMSDSITVSSNTVAGLENKNPDVCKAMVVNKGKTFADINLHLNKTAIQELASRGIINGKSADLFEPESTMTRAEFAAIVVRGLGLSKSGENIFEDVTADDWFFNYVATAYNYGIIQGVSQNRFNPNGLITLQEASVMVARASALCGINTLMDNSAVRDVLAQFGDYVLSYDWERDSLAFCYSKEIFNSSVIDIKPFEPVTRAEIASAIYNMLQLAKLL